MNSLCENDRDFLRSALQLGIRVAATILFEPRWIVNESHLVSFLQTTAMVDSANSCWIGARDHILRNEPLEDI